ncbi:hypothetical protein SKAU_G00412550 [Synaphobranchus kaupii]|uniref:Uncharacterized protein n=1 Tax=Synaphobranchus kaupii TaxID=118154 RepID=A0A9Q1E849_SYNKA|nr:hypothetical protein SKAU_G00412550 [Synaphobranchus kaupii]
MAERFLERQPAICATLLSPEVRRTESDLCTLNETDVSNAEDTVKALKPMKDATTLMSEESNPTVCLIAPLNAQLLQNMSDTIGDSPMIHEIKHAIKADLLKRLRGHPGQKQMKRLGESAKENKCCPWWTRGRYVPLLPKEGPHCCL